MKKEFKCRLLIAIVDLVLCVSSLFFALTTIWLLFGDTQAYLPKTEYLERILMHVAVSAIAVTWFWTLLRHYSHRKPFWFELKEVLRTLAILSIIELAILAFSKTYVSRYLWVLTWGYVLLLVPVGRIFMHRLLSRIGWLNRATVIIGCDRNAIDAYYALQSESYLAFDIKAFVGTNPDFPKDIDLPIIEPNPDELMQRVDKDNTQFIIALEQHEYETRHDWLRFLSKQGCRMVSVVPSIRGLPLYGTDMSFLFSYDVILLRINNSLARRSAQWLKRLMDFLGAMTLVILLSPALLVIYLLLIFNGGKPIYKHIRIGQNGKPFVCFKFRSMDKDAKEQLNSLLENDAEARKQWERDFKLKVDPRVTKTGHILRRTSLDELPQLFNVMKGEMSLVGPRPIVRTELTRYKGDLDYYLLVKPGMTGLWQISGRNEVDYETRVYFDSWYVKNWSLWIDIAILFKTIKIVINRIGAY